MAMHIGGSPAFEMMDDKRVAMNEDMLSQLKACEDAYAAVDLLAGMGGQVFNLANTVPNELESEVKDAVNKAVEAATESLEKQSNRSLAQNLLDVAGPPKEEGLMNCNPLAGGWVFQNLLREANQARIRVVHSRQWGKPQPGTVPHDK
eukprot:gnl/MRDRNA2_/MRDRNA2_105454_c0_seq1.p1 gnl/MRDRNA2_/MRDRNA2_105454_c0~~gnl/MRDRNA2_/MRDRNA2_105454_c0_seq1.p1  ORF type:complete len:174 (+),score=45.53 gnl/MRDRNA2_/MRDRNA2_105454_c0_seq1:79-522(+)